MWDGKRVSVILMTYAEAGSIRAVVEGFGATGVVDEVLVVNNNAEPGTREALTGSGAREVHEGRQGYGWACRRGLAEAQGELLVLCEPDGTFLPADVLKLLSYSADCDAVFGTRTTRELVWGGANMGAFLKWGNWAVAKLVEVLFNTSHLSDVGCTYKLVSRSLAQRLLPDCTVGDSHFGPELMLRVITSGARFVEIPVNYLPRVGHSAVTGDTRKAFVLGVRMIAFILRFRLATLGRQRRPRPPVRTVDFRLPESAPPAAAAQEAAG
jgi:glycosyltransferase involved in cell wall biosynthesis